MTHGSGPDNATSKDVFRNSQVIILANQNAKYGLFKMEIRVKALYRRLNAKSYIASYIEI